MMKQPHRSLSFAPHRQLSCDVGADKKLRRNKRIRIDWHRDIDRYFGCLIRDVGGLNVQGEITDANRRQHSLGFGTDLATGRTRNDAPAGTFVGGVVGGVSDHRDATEFETGKEEQKQDRRHHREFNRNGSATSFGRSESDTMPRGFGGDASSG